MQEEIDRVYFSMSEVCQQVKVPPTQIRYWTSYFKIHSDRKPGMLRKYTKNDIQKLIRIKSLADTKYFTLLGMKRIIAGVITFRYHI